MTRSSAHAYRDRTPETCGSATSALVLVALLMLGGCDRDATPGAPGLTASVGAELDPAIDPNDSYAIADIAQTSHAELVSDSAMADPATDGGTTTQLLLGCSLRDSF